MDRAIKGLACYTVVLLIVNTVLIMRYMGELLVLTPTIVVVAAMLNSPMLALGILVLIRMRRRGSIKLG